MGSVGDAYDNAMCGSFFATLECELLQRCTFQTKAEARMAVFAFIEGRYNPSRRHSALGYKSPIEFERSARHALASVSPQPSAEPVSGTSSSPSRESSPSPASSRFSSASSKPVSASW